MTIAQGSGVLETMTKDLSAKLDDHASAYENGTVTIADNIDFSTRDTVRQVIHYSLSKYMGGQVDEYGRRMPFQNIGNFIVDLEWRAKNIDRKHIRGVAKDGDWLYSLVVNKELQQLLFEMNFGKVIDDYQRKKTEFGAVLMKKTETGGNLVIEPVQWNNLIVDQHDILGGIKIEKNFLSLLDLEKKANLWTYESENDLSAFIQQLKKRKEGRGEVWDVEGEFTEAEVMGEGSEELGIWNLIIGIAGNKKYPLFAKKLKESRYKYDMRKAVEGRDFGVGVWEEMFEPQIWINEAVISEKEAMDIAGKVIIRTSKKNIPAALLLRNGEMLEMSNEDKFEPVSLSPQSLPKFENIIARWFQNAQRDQSAYPGVTGEQPKAGTPFIGQALQAAQAGSIFNKRRTQDGFFLAEIINDWVVPFLVKRVNQKHELHAAYSRSELERLDEMILGVDAKRMILSGETVTPEIEQNLRSRLKKQGNERKLDVPEGWLKVEDVRKKVRFDITDEMSDDQSRLNSLSVVLQTLPPDDPSRREIIEEMMELMGTSPASFMVDAPSGPQGNVAELLNRGSASVERIRQALPEGQR